MICELIVKFTVEQESVPGLQALSLHKIYVARDVEFSQNFWRQIYKTVDKLCWWLLPFGHRTSSVFGRSSRHSSGRETAACLLREWARCVPARSGWPGGLVCLSCRTRCRRGSAGPPDHNTDKSLAWIHLGPSQLTLIWENNTRYTPSNVYYLQPHFPQKHAHG